ncbi:MAG TPA: DUF4124 domain-containing protein [Nitrospirota bacterium]|nr:DUF4124 domain-containing protein [Nitrospirota bacterium]
MLPVLLLAACFLFFPAPAVSAEFYRWIDKDGKENFTNEPNKIPSEYRQQSSSVEVGSERVSIGDKPAGAGSAKGSDHKDKNGRGEEWWRRRAENLRLEIRDLEDEQTLVLKKEQEQERKATGGRKSKSKTNYEQKKMQLEKKIAKARRRLEVDLPEEARRADAYPGWLRE